MSQDREHLITQHNTNHEKSWWLSLRGFVIFIVLIAIGYYLFEKHRAHLFNVLPLVLLLLCPLMHFLCMEHIITIIMKNLRKKRTNRLWNTHLMPMDFGY